jgi:hypothetical protein
MAELTEEQVRDRFVNHLWDIITDIKNEERAKTIDDKLELAFFSFCVTIDGESASLPSFILAPDPHPDDKEFNNKRGEDWFPENKNLEVNADISGSLHERFIQIGEKRGLVRKE